MFAVDGYRVSAEHTARLRSLGPTLVVDDHGVGGPRPADWALDQNLGATPSPAGPPPERVLLGPDHALLREEVVAARPAAPPDRAGPVRRVLVAAGGDPPAALVSLLDVVGRDLATTGVDVVPLAGVADVGPVMAGVDLAVSAAGSTVWELCCLGLPAVVLATAHNQEPVARAVGEAGLAVDVGDLADLDPARVTAAVGGLLDDAALRQRLAEEGWRAVDGAGARRVAAALRSSLVMLRRATADDARLLWEWTNDPAVRRASFTTTEVGWDEHRAWLADRLADPASALWVATDHRGERLGQVRVEVAAGVGTIGFSLAPDRRGEGWAAPLLVAAAHAAARDLAGTGLQGLEGRVREGNEPSARAFVSAGFVEATTGTAGGAPARTYTRPCHG